MTQKNLSLLALLIFLGLTTNAKAQLFDGFTPQKGSLSLTASFTYSEFDKIYAGSEEVDLAGVEGVTQHIYSIYAKYGISDKVSAVINLPYITSNTDTGVDPYNGESSLSDFQDLGLAIKVNAYKFKFKTSNLNLITGLGINIPLGYEPNGIITIGNNAWGVDYSAGLHLNTDIGFFSTIFANYSLREDSKSSANNINSDFKVPNYFSTHGKIGYSSSFIYAEVWATYLNSDEGPDIGGEGFLSTGNFPEVDVESSSFGVTLYKNITPKLGLSLGYSNIFDGRNTTPASTYSGGLTFNLSK